MVLMLDLRPWIIRAAGLSNPHMHDNERLVVSRILCGVAYSLNAILSSVLNVWTLTCCHVGVIPPCIVYFLALGDVQFSLLSV